MALVVYDRVQETTTTTGTGSVTLAGAVAGYQSFAVVGNGNETFYCIVNGTAWEVGVGTYSTTGPTLARTTVLSNSNGNTSPITLSGPSNVFITYPSEKSVNYDASGVIDLAGNINVNGNTIYGGTGNNSILDLTGDARLSGLSSRVLIETGSGGTADNTWFFNQDGSTDFPGVTKAINSILSYNIITASGSTTTLVADSSYHQRVVGSTTQTIKLPSATGLSLGLSFLIDNDASATVTVVNDSSITVDTIPAGGIGYIFLEDNSTSAGYWGKYAWLPGNYDFSTATADFGTAVITNTTYQGNTIGTGYGGTGLTTFTAANNALYSTSSSALTAGTLPVAAGGTGVTSATANGVVYGNGTSALQVTAAGTTGQVLVGNTGAAPSWATVSSSLVSSFSAGTTGFTPSTATTGAVTLAGTLNVANGGTGLTSLTASYIPYGNGTSAFSSSSSLTYSSSTLSAPNLNASNGLVVNSNTVSASYSIPSGSSAMSVGPVTVASGQSVTVPTGSRWVVL